jgi:SAM-dependent methyltransferase
METQAIDTPDFTIITETPGVGATQDQLAILYTRYHFAASWVKGRDVIDVACGTGVGLGFLAREAAQVTGGDLDAVNCRLAAETYREHPRVRVQQFDAQNIPFPDKSFDVAILFEAIYYLPDASQFLREAWRVLRPGGILLISSVNCAWHGFNPSIYSRKYYDSHELRNLLTGDGFTCDLRAGFPDYPSGLASALVQRVRRAARRLHLIPRTMKGKTLLKRLFYGRLMPIPREITEGMARLEPLIEVALVQDITAYKMMYVVAHKQTKSNL